MKDSHLIISLLCFASLSVLCGCTHSELSEEGDGATAPLCIGQAWTGGLVTDTDTDDSATTRAEGASKVLEKPDDAIGLFLKANALEGYENAITNQQYTYGTPSWQPLANEKPLQLTKKLAKMAAYYPYVEEQKDTVKPLTCGPYNEATKGKMFYYKNFTASMYNASVNLDLRRPYSLLRFIVSKDNRYTGKGEVTYFKWTVSKLTTSGYLDLLEGKVIKPKPGSQGEEIRESFVVENVDDPNPYKMEYLVVPSEFTGSLTVNVTADGTEYSPDPVTAAALCGGTTPTFVEGMVYEIRVTLRPGKLTVQAITVTPWVPEEVGGKLENK